MGFKEALPAQVCFRGVLAAILDVLNDILVSFTYTEFAAMQAVCVFSFTTDVQPASKWITFEPVIKVGQSIKNPLL